jgi:YggT family protein
MSWQYLLVSIVDLYAWIVMAYCILSWIPDVGNSVLRDVKSFLARLVEPFLRPFQRLIPPIGGMVDISPIIAFFVLQWGVRLIVGLF